VETGKQRLADQALRLKKSWILAAIWIGAGDQLGLEARSVHDYRAWPKKKLLEHIPLLQDDFCEVFGQIVDRPDTATIKHAARWMSERFDQWQKAEFGLCSLCTAREFELECGLLKARAKIEVPPYAEVFMQGEHPVAIRHPEYMLARDLECLYSLFLDCESLLSGVNWGSPPKWAGGASENGQTLARAVIQTCFNLLESFVSGLARAHLLEHPDLPADTTKKLLSQDKSLRQRITFVPELIVGRRCGLELNAAPLDRLFGEIKQARDSFVHCEPGPQASLKTGKVKEHLFHDVSKELVAETVLLTWKVIRHLWVFVFDREGPRWLPTLVAGTLKRDLQLNPVLQPRAGPNLKLTGL